MASLISLLEEKTLLKGLPQLKGGQNAALLPEALAALAEPLDSATAEIFLPLFSVGWLRLIHLRKHLRSPLNLANMNKLLARSTDADDNDGGTTTKLLLGLP
nr:hypothetical transcript [Hymenolepis microstoma]